MLCRVTFLPRTPRTPDCWLLGSIGVRCHACLAPCLARAVARVWLTRVPQGKMAGACLQGQLGRCQRASARRERRAMW